MRTTTLATLLILAVGAAGCDSPVDPAPDGPAAVVVPAGVVASATGSAHRIRGGELWVIAFNAVKRADGTVTGNARVDRKDAGVSFDIAVTCMSVVDNAAWIAGIIENQSGDLAVNGTVSYFYVFDNGEGANAAADVASAVRLNDAAGQDLVFCEDRPLLLPASVIDHGNVQVH